MNNTIGNKHCNTFTTEKDGVKLEVCWGKPVFIAKYKVGDVVLQYSRHIMSMSHKRYNEASLKDEFEKIGLYASFKEAGDIISNQTVFFEAAEAQFAIKNKELKERYKNLNNKLRELKQKVKAHTLTKDEYHTLKEPLENQKAHIQIAYYDICKNTADEIEVINQNTKELLTGYLQELWRNTNLPKLLTWEIYVPDNDDFYSNEQEMFEDELQRGHYDFEKIPGKNDSTKCIYFLPNITKEDSEELAGHFQNVYSFRPYQKSFAPPGHQLDEFLTSKKLNAEFPIYLDTLSENFFNRYRYPEKTSEQLMAEVNVYVKNAANHTSKERWEYRNEMYHKPEVWELKDDIRNQYYEMWKKK